MSKMGAEGLTLAKHSGWKSLTRAGSLIRQVQRSLEELNAELDRHDTARSEMFPDKPAGEVPKPTT